jgi:TonB family protein
MKKFGLVALVAILATWGLTGSAWSRSLSFICEGKISHYPLMAYTAIAGKDNEDKCIFITSSPEGRKILQVCPKDSQCSVEAEVNNSGDANEIYKVKTVRRTGTPALDAKVKRDREVEHERRFAAIRPLADKLTSCVRNHLKGAVSEEAKDALDEFCARERDTLGAKYIEQFGPGGHYLHMDYLSHLEPTAAKNTDKFPMRIRGDWCSITDGMGPQYRRGTCPKNSKVERWLKVRPDEYVGHEFGCSVVKGVTEGDVFRAQLSCGGEGQEWTQTDRFILRGEKLTIQQIEHGHHKDTEAMAPPVPESSMDRSDKPTSDADVADWKKMVVSSLERNKRYPAEALGRGESGVARIYFELDREGRVMSSRILSSSGSAMLDQEALDILRRASPFPAPPTSLGQTVKLTVPIRFNATPTAETTKPPTAEMAKPPVIAEEVGGSAGTREMRHDRPCDIAQDNPGNLNPDGGNAIMFGLCTGIRDLPIGEDASRAHFWNAFNCGYQGYRQGKPIGTNPFYNAELKDNWNRGWKEAEKACTTGRKPFSETKTPTIKLEPKMLGEWCNNAGLYYVRGRCKSGLTITADGWKNRTNGKCTIIESREFREASWALTMDADVALAVKAKCERFSCPMKCFSVSNAGD